ncbi:protein dead ringer homolog isoform X2 [Pseudomyrmex gracilis]|uniref:protein dead ringer homolog isoform X2 n=1 Tax=Pseudomyrmex gracilis TaxID=219809 RepID=UPI00099531A3|nr:protein dead ringer homolog isoform X2 [Pseudomyrmex gracilis]
MDSSDDTELENTGGGVPNGSASNTNNGAPSGSSTSAVTATNGHESNGHGHLPSPEDLTSYTRESNDYELEECNESEDEEENPQSFPTNPVLDVNATMSNYLTNPRVLEKLRQQGEVAMVANEMLHRNGVDFMTAFNANNVGGVNLFQQFCMQSTPVPSPLLSNVGINQRTPSPPLTQNIPSTLENNQMAIVHTNIRSLTGQPISTSRPLSVSPQPGSSRNNGEIPITPLRNNGESRDSNPSPRTLGPVNNQHGAVQSSSNWSYEEQFRQLYEIDDNPERKIFLDKLFSFMHQRGTPINRLPIMAKSVLDLFELYKLVIQRGGLVEVINKKLWQEIIKGLRLPASITSAAFTLRTQYMKYLYPYEQTHERLSTSGQLQQAIETNKRESRQKPSPQMMGVAYSASRDNQAALGMNTLSLGLTGPINPSGSQQTRSPHILMPNGGQHPQHLPQMPNEILADYVMKMINEQRRNLPQENQSQTIESLGLARMMWMYQQQNMYPGRPPTPEPSPPTPEPPTPEPQALDLARSDSDRSSSRPVSPRGEPSTSRKENRESTDHLPTSNCKRKSFSDDEEPLENSRKSKTMKPQTAIRTQTFTICEFRPDALVVEIKLDNTVYQGTIPVKHDERNIESDADDASGRQQ